MKFEKSREEFYESEIHRMASQIAKILDAGLAVELAKSRSGLKLFSVSKKHQVVRREKHNGDV